MHREIGGKVLSQRYNMLQFQISISDDSESESNNNNYKQTNKQNSQLKRGEINGDCEPQPQLPPHTPKPKPPHLTPKQLHNTHCFVFFTHSLLYLSEPFYLCFLRVSLASASGGQNLLLFICISLNLSCCSCCCCYSISSSSLYACSTPFVFRRTSRTLHFCMNSIEYLLLLLLI